MLHAKRYPATLDHLVAEVRRLFTLYDKKYIDENDLIENVIYYKNTFKPAFYSRVGPEISTRIKAIIGGN